jgi:hypothetical protein
MAYTVHVNGTSVSAPLDYTRAWDNYATVTDAIRALSHTEVFAEPVTIQLCDDSRVLHTTNI